MGKPFILNNLQKGDASLNPFLWAQLENFSNFFHFRIFLPVIYFGSEDGLDLINRISIRIFRAKKTIFIAIYIKGVK